MPSLHEKTQTRKRLLLSLLALTAALLSGSADDLYASGARFLDHLRVAYEVRALVHGGRPHRPRCPGWLPFQLGREGNPSGRVQPVHPGAPLMDTLWQDALRRP
ncbi:MAG: hypothetical protein L0Z62_21185, partial [Gemmataceae bacterium]|nr:hypothetical protein [Gemmataceae bacterium]